MIVVETSAHAPSNPCRLLRPSPEPTAPRTLFHHPTLARIESELAGLSTRLSQSAALQRDPAGLHPGVDGPGLLGKLRIHLFLTASLLLPMWRDLCDDARDVDRTEVQLGQLRALVNHALNAGPQAPLAEAYVAVLADELRRQQQRSLVLLRAMQAVVGNDRLQALGALWEEQNDALLACGSRVGEAGPGLPCKPPQSTAQSTELDNEDADPVGPRDQAAG